MAVYLINIALTLFVCLTAEAQSKDSLNKARPVAGKVPLFYIVSLLLLWCSIFAFRDSSVGSDTEGYKYFFELMANSNETLGAFLSEQRDMLFGWLEYAVARLTGGNWIAFLAVCSLLIYSPVLLLLRNNTRLFTPAALLYIFTGNLYNGYNGLRQAIAISIVFFAYYKFFNRERYLAYGITMAVAFGFHSTALIAVPFHFLTRLNAKSKTVVTVTIVLLISFIFLWSFWSYLISFFEAIGQSKLANDYINATENGSSLLRFLVYFLPVAVGYAYYDRMKEKYDDIDSDLVMLLISAVFMLFSTKYWLFARVAGYFSLTTILLIPKFECIFPDGKGKNFVVIILLLYALFMVALLMNGEGSLYPYEFAEPFS